MPQPVRQRNYAVASMPSSAPVTPHTPTAINESVALHLNRLVIDGDQGIIAKLQTLPDHRKARGIRHQLSSILTVCVVAMLSGCHNATEIAEWADDLPEDALARLSVRRSPKTGGSVPPSEPTVRRTLHAIDNEALDRLVGEVLQELVGASRNSDKEKK